MPGINANLPRNILEVVLDLAVVHKIAADVVPDSSAPSRGFWRIKVGDTLITGFNTAAAVAFLDGVRVGAAQQMRLLTLGDWAADE